MEKNYIIIIIDYFIVLLGSIIANDMACQDLHNLTNSSTYHSVKSMKYPVQRQQDYRSQHRLEPPPGRERKAIND